MSHSVPLAPGQLFARDYRVIRPLAQGGMGSVYVVEQLSTSEQRALKTLHPQFSMDPRTRQRFDQEARVAAQIPSAHVVKIVQAGVDEATGMPWLCMELLAGETMADSVARSGYFAPGTVATLFEQIGHALELAHRIPLVHRDLKPENIFLAHAQSPGVPFTAKVLDFGIAKLAQESSSTQAVGSPLWMAPEQLGNSPVSPTTDVWALGLVAYYALTGRYYWRSANESAPVMSVILEVASGERPAASRRAAESGGAPLPPGFDAWFARCTAQDPAARFPHAGVARDALLAVLQSASGPRGNANAQPVSIGYDATGYMPATPAPMGNALGPATPPPAQIPSPYAQSYPQPAGTNPSAAAKSSSGAVAAAVGVLALATVVTGGFLASRKLSHDREREREHRAMAMRGNGDTPRGNPGAASGIGAVENCEVTRACPDPLHEICVQGPSPRCEPSPAGARIRLSYDGIDPRWVGPARYQLIDFHPDPTRNSTVSFGFSERLNAGVGQITVFIPRGAHPGGYRIGTHPAPNGSFVHISENLALPGRYRGGFDSVDGELVLTQASYEFGGHLEGRLQAQVTGGNDSAPVRGELSMEFSVDLPR